MTFDIGRAKEVADTGDLMRTTKWLLSAIAEIERLQAELKNWQCEFPCSEEKWCSRQNLCARMKALDVSTDEDGCITIRNQAKRIEELGAEVAEWKAKYEKLLKAKQETEEMYNPSDLPEPWV